jgi:hypothetical protein
MDKLSEAHLEVVDEHTVVRHQDHDLTTVPATLYAAALPAIPLCFQTDPYILPRWLKGVEPTGTLYPSILWVERWRRVP